MANQYINAVTATWNSGITTFDGIKLTVTDSASASDSRLLALLVGSANKLVLDKSGNLTITNNDAGASAGPVFTMKRDSASPAASDIIGKMLFQGEDDAGNTQDFAEVYSTITDPASGSEDASLLFRAVLAGTMTTSLTLTGSGASFAVPALPASSDGAALGSTSYMWSDLFLASGGVINWNNGDVLATHSANALAFSGASSGYSFDVTVSVGPTAGDSATIGPYTSSDTDITALVAGTTAGGLVEGTVNGHLVLGIRDNGTTDSLAIISGSGNWSSDTTYDKLVAQFFADGTSKYGGNTSPTSNDGASLGISGTAWSDLFLASGGVINFNAGDVTITHSSNALAFAGASSGYSFDAAVLPSSNDAAALGSASASWSDGFFASGAVLNFNNGDVTITHSSNALAFAGASSGYSMVALLDLSGASAGQVKFPATQNASSNANTLDDYEEGSFTPVIEGTSTAGTGTYVGQSATYCKVGRVVVFTIYVSWTAHTGTGNMIITGLPFTAASSAPCSIRVQSLTYSNDLVATVPSSTANVVLQTMSSGAAYADLPIDSSGTIFICGTYLV